MAHGERRWTNILPVVLLGIRTAWKEDLRCSVAELVYGEPLRIPGEFLHTPKADQLTPSDFVSQLRKHMALLRPQAASRHSSTSIFVHDGLKTCKNVFIRNDALRASLDPPYTGPYRVLARSDKILTPLNRGPVKVSIDRVKPAYITADSTSTTVIAPEPAIKNPDSQRPVRTTRSGRIIEFQSFPGLPDSKGGRVAAHH